MTLKYQIFLHDVAEALPAIKVLSARSLVPRTQLILITEISNSENTGYEVERLARAMLLSEERSVALSDNEPLMSTHA